MPSCTLGGGGAVCWQCKGAGSLHGSYNPVLHGVCLCVPCDAGFGHTSAGPAYGHEAWCEALEEAAETLVGSQRLSRQARDAEAWALTSCCVGWDWPLDLRIAAVPGLELGCWLPGGFACQKKRPLYVQHLHKSQVRGHHLCQQGYGLGAMPCYAMTSGQTAFTTAGWF